MKQIALAFAVAFLLYMVWSSIDNRNRVQIRTLIKQHGYMTLLFVLAFVALFGLFLAVVSNNGINLY